MPLNSAAASAGLVSNTFWIITVSMVIPYSFMKYAAQAESRATTVSAGFSVQRNDTRVSSRVIAAHRNSPNEAKNASLCAPCKVIRFPSAFQVARLYSVTSARENTSTRRVEVMDGKRSPLPKAITDIPLAE